MADINLSAALSGLLSEYGKEVRKGVEDSVKKTGREVRREIQENSPESDNKKHGGRYKKGWRTDFEESALGKNTVIVYNKTDYQLTHLLEHGHLNRDGTSRAKAIPHIKPAEEKAKTALMERIERVIERAGQNK